MVERHPRHRDFACAEDLILWYEFSFAQWVDCSWTGQVGFETIWGSATILKTKQPSLLNMLPEGNQERASINACFETCCEPRELHEIDSAFTVPAWSVPCNELSGPEHNFSWSRPPRKGQVESINICTMCLILSLSLHFSVTCKVVKAIRILRLEELAETSWSMSNRWKLMFGLNIDHLLLDLWDPAQTWWLKYAQRYQNLNSATYFVLGWSIPFSTSRII